MFHVDTAPEFHRALVQRAGEEDLRRVPVWRPIVDELHDQPGTFVAQIDQGALSRGVWRRMFASPSRTIFITSWNIASFNRTSLSATTFTSIP